MTLDSVVSPQVLNKYLILVDVKSGRFKYQSGSARDETKKLKSPTKSERVGIYVLLKLGYYNCNLVLCCITFFHCHKISELLLHVK